jgi:multimeric flavodoxin WrbA
MMRITAIYGSPRRQGNTSRLLQQAVAGARDEGAAVTEIMLRDIKIAPCMEIYGCTREGECVIQDGFQRVRDSLLASDGIMLASPIFFYTVSAHTKIFMDRCQSLWVKKYWIEGLPRAQWPKKRKGLFISAGATRGRKLFDGALLTVRYFFDVIDTSLWKSLLYRGLDFENDVMEHPDYLQEAYETGGRFATLPTGNDTDDHQTNGGMGDGRRA